MSGKTNEEYKKFESVMRKLVTVPKSEIDQRVGEYNKRKELRKSSKQKRKS